MSCALLSGLLLAASGTAHATTYYWVGADGSSWNNAANWSPSAIPGEKDSVVIPGKKKVAVSVAVAVANLSVGAGAEVKNGGKIKVSGRTNSTGLFTGAGTLDVPKGAVATFNVNKSSVLAATSGTTAPAVVFAPITNKGRIVTNVAQGCRVDFAAIQNSGSTQIISDGTVTFKDIKNTQQIDVKASGTVTLAKIDNASGGSISIASTLPATPLVGTRSTRSGKDDGGNGDDGNDDNDDPSVVHLDDLTNHKGGKVKLSGVKGGRLFNGKSIDNEGDMEISGAQTLLDGDVLNSAGGTLTFGDDATVFPSGGKAPKLRNSGKIVKVAGSDATLKVEWTNTGQVVVEEGTLHVRLANKKGATQTSGTTTLEGGVLSIEDDTSATSKGVFEVAGGVVDGIGTIEGNVINSAGSFRPGHSPGTITINGNFTQTSGGVLDMELGGSAPGTGYDQILVKGTAYLAGTLNLIRWNNYVPRDGDVYTLFTYYSKVGNFTKFVDTTPTSGIGYDTTLTPTDYEVSCYSTAPTDTVPPAVAITSPVNGRGAPSFTSATGTASDNFGVASVTGRLYRYANTVTGVPAGYWNGGTSWTATATADNEELARGTTAWTFAFPTLPAGRYSLRTTAKDAAGNSSFSPTISFWVDPNAPSVLTVDTPASGSTVSALFSLGGAVSDAADGSGIMSVQGQLRRLADGLYWNGSSWSANVFSFSVTLSGTRWSRFTNLPTGTNLKTGTYSAIVIATDRAGNTRSTTSNFTVSTAKTSVNSG
ncbi:hypothetical protein EON83_20985 [bacterium]|nr:MAG: hypothetical protein EON83_20985 [bacterium]